MLEICRVPPERLADFLPQADDGGAGEAYEARKNGIRLGGCRFAVKGDRGRILALSVRGGGEETIGVALLRCVLSRMASEGVREAAAGDAADGCLLKAAGFRQAGGEWALPLDKIPRPHCGA